MFKFEVYFDDKFGTTEEFIDNAIRVMPSAQLFTYRNEHLTGILHRMRVLTFYTKENKIEQYKTALRNDIPTSAQVSIIVTEVSVTSL